MKTLRARWMRAARRRAAARERDRQATIRELFADFGRNLAPFEDAEIERALARYGALAGRFAATLRGLAVTERELADRLRGFERLIRSDRPASTVHVAVFTNDVERRGAP
jgi:hypothetical protein